MLSACCRNGWHASCPGWDNVTDVDCSCTDCDHTSHGGRTREDISDEIHRVLSHYWEDHPAVPPERPYRA